jgi:translation initiation factor IF-2
MATKSDREPIELPSNLTVGELGEKLGASPINVIKTLMRNGIMATINQELDFDTAAIVATDLGVEVIEEGAIVEPEPTPEPLIEYPAILDEPVEEVELAPVDVEEEAEEAAGPRRRRRRGAGSATAAEAEIDEEELALQELLKEPEEPVEAPEPEELLVKRPPVVTIMGHVDHGKTALLDTIRSTNVIATEAGGITQHIGAYQVERHGERITFLDTPGHAAFTAMRARGARVTDIAIIVVAASEGVMPQTIEAIDHARAAHVPIIIAMNKMDLPDANPDRAKAQLGEIGLSLVEWGGDVEVVNVSAKTGEGIDDLLETITLTAELADGGKGLRANPKRDASGIVIEARMDRQKGPLATAIIQRGTLKVGQYVVAGGVVGKARALTDDHGRQIKEAGPSTPVTVLGIGDVPAAGDRLKVFATEREARSVAEARSVILRQGTLQRPRRTSSTVTDIFAQMERGQAKDLNLVIKADVQGSLEAIIGVLQEMDRTYEELSDGGSASRRIRILHSAVGPITESDILLASASDAMVIGFGVSPDPGARRATKAENVELRQYNIIYKLTEDIEAMLAGAVEPVYQEVVYGHAEVRQTFTAGRTSIIGGYVTDGRIPRNSTIRVVRAGDILWTGGLASLKRFKDDVREVANGFEFGMTLDGFNDFNEGDSIESFGQERMG